jgi:hypothetical protein
MATPTSGVLAMREAYFHAEDPRAASTLIGAPGFNAWGRFEARRLRYDVHWSFWQNDAYRRIHTWSRELKALFGLYKHTRHIYNPAHRITEFFVCHVFNGSLDPAAGDGSEIPSAIPIAVDEAGGKRNAVALRGGLAQLWRDTRLQSTKSNWIRYGTVMGDAPLAILDEPEVLPGTRPPRPGRVRLEPWHPGVLKWVDVEDDRITPRAYIREEMRYNPDEIKKLVNISPRIDPLASVRTSVYTEVAELVNGGVRYQTYKDYELYDWTGMGGPGEWIAPYPIIPLVLCQHIPIGGEWGMGEFHSDAPKIREADDMASKLDDQIRKLVDSPWLFVGFKEADLSAQRKRIASGLGDRRNNPEGDREDVTSLFASDAAAKAQALVAEMPIAEVSEHIGTILEEIERDHPELRYDRLTVSGELSGTALRKARQGAETKVNERRAEYDFALSRAQEIALTIGGIRGYDGYTPSVPDDLTNGRWRHLIGDRTVFGVDSLERLEEEQAEATATQTWTSAGVPLRTALVKVGWSEEDADAAAAEKDAEDLKANSHAIALVQAKGPDVATKGDGKTEPDPANPAAKPNP